jgi:proton glutamate symport protein
MAISLRLGFPKLTLTTQIFLALGLGIAVGVLAPDIAVQLAPLSKLFLNMIKMLIAPLLLATLTVGIAGSGDHAKVGRMGMKTILYFEVATTLALAIGLITANWLQPGAGVEVTTAATQKLAELGPTITTGVKAPGLMDTIIHMVPTSVIDAMAKGEILQLVVFCIFFALALMAAGEKGKPVLQGLESLAEVMFKFVGYVMVFAPMGVFGAIASTVGENGLGILVTFAKLAGSLYLALAVFVLIVLVSVCSIVKVPFLKLLTAIREPFLLAFTTASSESALPKAMAVMERFGVPKYVVSFVMPTGYTFNLDGSTLYLALATLFVAQVSHVDLGWQQQIMILLTLMLTSKGVAAVPRASLLILAATLGSFNIPMAGVAMILGIDHFLDMGRTAVNLVGNCVATVVVARWEGVLDDQKMHAFSSCEDGDDTLECVSAINSVGPHGLVSKEAQGGGHGHEGAELPASASVSYAL